MKRRGLLVALIVGGALVGFLVWLPARFFAALMPADLRCGELSGSFWTGRCRGLSIRGSRSGDVYWQIHRPEWQPWRAHVGFVWIPKSDVPGGTADAGVTGTITARLDGRLSVQLSSAQLSLQALRDAMPADVTLGPIAAVAGRLESCGLQIELDERRRLAALRGRVELRVTRLLRFDAQIGDFAAEFSGLTGRIEDLGGSIGLVGDARLTEPGAYAVTLRVTPRVTGLLPALPGGAPLEISVDGRL